MLAMPRIDGQTRRMDEIAYPRDSASWRVTVWGLRVMGIGLLVVVAGIIALVSSGDAARAVLFAGIGVYVVGLVITVVAITIVFRSFASPRPSFLDMRWVMLRDATHRRPRS